MEEITTSEFFLLITGIFLLVSGIFIMRHGLKKLLWNRLKTILCVLTVTPWRGLLLGTIAAAIMQSSTAVSLITIGLVTSEYLTFYQSIGIILGANIGTCSTVQLMTLKIPPACFYWGLLITAIIAICYKQFRQLAIAPFGLFCMFAGLHLITVSIADISTVAVIMSYLQESKANCLYGIIAGILLTTLFQSSSAATGLLMMLAANENIDVTTAAYVVYGNNIGSCLSSVIISTAAPITARQVALSHILLNIGGVMIFLPFTPIFTHLTAVTVEGFANQIALLHTVFNIISSLAVLPFVRQYAAFIACIIPAKK